jgi:hypothetical protein
MALPILSIEQIEAALDLKELEVEVPEWKGSVLVGALTLEERDDVMAACMDNGRHDGKLDAQKLVRFLVLKGVKQPKFTEAQLKKRSFKIVDRLANIIMELSGMKPEAPVVADVNFRQESRPPLPVSASA